MASKRELGIEKQPSEFRERAGSHSPKILKPENVDALVSRFLAELTDLSKEMDKSGQRDSKPGPAAAAEEANVSSFFGLREDAGSGTDPDLERINAEIERSLAELETLTPDYAIPKENPPLETKMETTESAVIQAPAPAVIQKEKTPAAPVTPAPVLDPEEQARARMEIFRESVVHSRTSRRSAARWIFVGAVMIAVLGIAAIYFYSANGEARNETNAAAGGQTSNPERAPDAILQMPADPVPLLSIADAQKNSNPADPVKIPAQEGRKDKGAAKSASWSPETGAGRTSGREAELQNWRPVESTNNGFAAEITRAARETPIPASTPVTGGAETPVQLPAPVSSAPAAAIQAQSGPAVSGSTGEAPGSVGATAAVPIPATPMPGLTENNVVPEAPTQPKTRTPTPAEAIKKVPPNYPVLARAQKISGKVEVEVEISDSGDVVSAVAVSGPDMLRGAAQEALTKWKFKPASVDGISIPSRARITVAFNLQ
jgi:TonB family protein